MMERQWLQQCHELLNKDHSNSESTPERFDLIFPRSRCPNCQHLIHAWENIPLISYLLLRGRCANCKQRISLRYPFIELLCAAITAFTAWYFGPTWQAAAAIVLSWALIVLIFIDYDHQLLPDSITLPFLWLGILVNLSSQFTDIQSSIIGAVCGYLTLWSIFHLFRLVTGKEGMGYGDFKLFALFGAWLGWQYLPLILLLSSFVGATIGIALIVFQNHKRGQPIPFGPYIAIAGWIALLWGNQIISFYLRSTGMATPTF
jgi:leader peptidase (prepilin peptidase)/N-methyltransferase